jgi:branched-chain amino acid aminotransferase
VGSGKPGPVTRGLQESFFGLFNGSTRDRWGWLSFVHAVVPDRESQEAGIHARTPHQQPASLEASA